MPCPGLCPDESIRQLRIYPGPLTPTTETITIDGIEYLLTQWPLTAVELGMSGLVLEPPPRPSLTAEGILGYVEFMVDCGKWTVSQAENNLRAWGFEPPQPQKRKHRIELIDCG